MRATVPHFSNYDGSTCFSYENKIYYYKKNIGSGCYASVDLFESINPFTQVAIKSEANNIYKTFPNGFIFQMESQWCKKVHGLGAFSGNPTNNQQPHYIILPYFEGPAYFEIPYQSSRDVLFYWMRAAQATHQLHTQHNAVHCDIKTDNIIFNHEMARMIDFGFMKKKREMRDNMFDDCIEDRKIFWHQPPEVFTNKRKSIHAAETQDIYSLGILLRDMMKLYLNNNALTERDSEIQKCIEAIEGNLTHRISQKRWSIAKAIYLLVSTFFSQISTEIWVKTTDIKTINDLSTMPEVWKHAATTAITIRINELTGEEKSDIKQHKIDGLKALRSEIIIVTPERFLSQLTDTKIKFPKLTSGFFLTRTETVLNELTALAPCFYSETTVK